MNSFRKLDPIEDAQQYLGGISRTALYDLIARERIQRVKIGRRAFVTRSSMDAYVASLSGEAR